MIIEACVETLDEALLAESRGADRIELCADLFQDGLTPSEDLIREVNQRLKIPVKVMIRPREGDFVYTRAEVNQMRSSIEFCKKEKVFGVVFGTLNDSGELDLDIIRELTEASLPLEVTIHKAIDLTSDLLASVKALLLIPGIHSVLSSGKFPTALEGIHTLQDMIAATEKQIEIIVAGKVTELNIDSLHKSLGAPAYHGRRIVGDLG